MNEQRVTYRTIESSSTYSVSYSFKNSDRTRVIFGCEYKSLADAEKEARKRSENDCINVYIVSFVSKDEMYLGDVFMGVKSNELKISRWFDGQKINW